MVEEPVDSWSILWDEKYADSILMQDSVRDAFMVALKLNGNSMNTLDETELAAARDLLIKQKPLVQAYVIDQVRDKMIGGEAALGVIYSGEAIFTQRENPDLEYVIPKEGTNVWIDSWVIPKNAPNKENAEKFIDFMCRGDVALKNFEYITYSTPNDAARDLIEDEDLKNSKIAFPDLIPVWKPLPISVKTGIPSIMTCGRKLNPTNLWNAFYIMKSKQATILLPSLAF